MLAQALLYRKLATNVTTQVKNVAKCSLATKITWLLVDFYKFKAKNQDASRINIFILNKVF